MNLRMSHGIHHVTAIAGTARLYLAFYTRTLGLRLVKKTVNFDDPGTITSTMAMRSATQAPS